MEYMPSHPTSKLIFVGALMALVGVHNFFIANADDFALATTTAAASSSLQDQINTDNQQVDSLNQQIAAYQAQLKQIGSDKKTLQAAITALDLQRNTVQARISITQTQMAATQLEIQQLGGEITDTQKSIAIDQASLASYLLNIQKADHKSLMMQVLASNNLSDIWDDVNATLEIQGAIQTNLETLQAQRRDLANSQSISQEKQATLVSQKQALAAQQQSLAATVQAKNQLLSQTKAKESTYQQLLADAEAQLQSFSAFVHNAGGSKLLPNQTSCDAWGCYYSQRDTAWGGLPLNGTKFNLASDGCLVTSMAMVLTHYGYHDVTPVTINSNPANFASYYPAYLLYSVDVDGITATRKSTTIDATLATGNPVIVGLHAYGGTHYVVLVSGSKGKYLMRDPYIANGKDISFSANYLLKNIFGITRVVISS
jgi:peptidoglycan hydrolase CwlO-like protein